MYVFLPRICVFCPFRALNEKILAQNLRRKTHFELGAIQKRGALSRPRNRSGIRTCSNASGRKNIKLNFLNIFFKRTRVCHKMHSTLKLHSHVRGCSAHIILLFTSLHTSCMFFSPNGRASHWRSYSYRRSVANLHNRFFRKFYLKIS